MPKPHVPDWWFVGIDETAHWNFLPDLQPFVEKVVSVWAMDRAAATNCCELTPSYEFHPINTYAVFKGEPSEEVRERIFETVSFNQSAEVKYYHCAGIEKRLAPIDDKGTLGPRLHHVGAVDEETEDKQIETLQETWNANPKFYE